LGQRAYGKKNTLGLVLVRKERDRRPWSLGLVVIVGCFERPDPPWLLDESVEILAVRAEVIVDSPDAATLAPIPADRLRAEALPGDKIRASLVAASQSGIAEPDDIDAHWFICRDFECVNELRDFDMFSPCDGTLDRGEGCSLGTGPSKEFVLPPITDTYLVNLAPADINIGVVLGTPEGPGTGECVVRLRRRPYPSLAGCSLFQHIMYGGPSWKVAELIGLELDPESFPEQIRFVPPNFNPEVERFDVAIRGADGTRQLVVTSGEHVGVREGERVRFGVQVDPRDRQRYLATYGDEILASEETLQFNYFADVAVSTSTEFWSDPEIAWTVTADIESVTFVATLVDMRGGVAWGTIIFDVEGMAS
jgi:hypothetical protein